MEIKQTWFGCLLAKDGTLTKKKFDTREEARKFVSEKFDPATHTQCWTE